MIASGVRSSWKRWPQLSLFGDVRFESREHGVKGVAEFTQLISTAL